MSTYAEMADAIESDLSGFTQTIETATVLLTTIESDDVVISVADINSFSRGVVQIEDELIYVTSVDTASGLLNVAPGWGRGYRGTTAATHLAGVKVVSTPTYPRSTIKRRINEVIASTFPTLWAVGSTTITMAPGETTYALPVGVKDILQVTWEDTVTLEDVIVRRWKHDKFNNKIAVYDAIAPGRIVTINYRKEATALVNDTDDFATVTGLPQSCKDVIELGVAVRMLPWLEANNSSILSAEADFAANTRVSSTGALQLSRALTQNYQLRLAEEGMKLNTAYPVRIHYSV